MPVPISEWVIFNIFILLMLAVDLFVFRHERKVGMKESLAWTTFWVSSALLFNGYLYYYRGSEDALMFLTGYLIELSLSVDNLFVFLLIFKYFHTPPKSLHTALFWGVLGAIILRALFIWFGILIINRFYWMTYLFGAFLIFTGIKLWFEKDKKIDPEKNPILRAVRYFFPVTKEYVGDKFFVIKDGVKMATPLFIVLIAIETTDIIFAVDSIPAILAITQDPFLVYTSNIFAIVGLRSLYFVLSHVLSLFHYLHYGLALILIFIGTKMVMADLFHLSTIYALGFVFAVLVFSILLSILFPKPKLD